jgi:hypothetical protein
MHHIRHHIHDNQYGIRADGLSEFLADLLNRIERLEGAAKSKSAPNKSKVNEPAAACN